VNLDGLRRRVPFGDVEPAAEGGPPLPLGRRVVLPGRGTTFLREVPGPPAAATIVLVHGWMASGGINWFRVFEPLGSEFRVIAPDLRGHARGLRTRHRFRLADCADDIALTLDTLGIEQAIVVGYSMGGPIAQLLWHRHPDRVAGLVMVATSHRFVPGMRERMIFTSTMAVAAGTTRAGQVVSTLPRSWAQQTRRFMAVRQPVRPDSMRHWAAAEMRRHDIRLVLEAGGAIGRYDARRWIGEVDVPTAVVVTTLDRAVPPAEQVRTAFAIPGATVHRCEDGHVACAGDVLATPLVAACREVAERAGLGRLA
jgi:pimeloyl-ACP methyl ester carboxylesterase